MYNGNNKIRSTRGGLTVAEILEQLEELDDNVQNINIFVIPPLDRDDTDHDSDASDDEHEGNLNHLGPKLLNAECEVQRIDSEDDWSEGDDEPLAKYIKLQRGSKLNWKKENPTYEIEAECEVISPSIEAKTAKTPTDYFQLFFSEQLLNHCVEQTNLYALQKNIDLKVTLEEIKVFIGGLLMSGYAKYPNKRLYWSEKSDIPKLLSNSIRLNRFEKILNNFHINDNTKSQNNYRLFKIRPLIEHLNAAFLKNGGIDEFLSIDESMIPYYGKHYAKQYIRGKPIRFGFKNWALNTSNGYMLQFDIHMGKNEDAVPLGFGVGGDKVVDLITRANIPSNKGFKVFIDNYFTSVKLLRHLSASGICSSGTIRDGRTEKCPLRSVSEMKKDQRGSADYRFTDNGNILVVRWKDNNVVTLGTNFDNIEMGTCKRYKRGQGAMQIAQPKLFQRYNQGMGGVDKMDQLIAVYRSRIRQRKWWWPIFAYLLDASVVNGWLLMRKLHPNAPDCSNLLQFRRYIATYYLETYGVPSARGSRSSISNADIRYDGRNHIIDYSKTDKRCASCGKKSNFICIKCNKGLHPKECFKKFHTTSDYTA